MNKTIKNTSEYVHNIIKFVETCKIVENTLQEYEQKNGGNYRKIVKVICFAEVLDKVKDQTKNNTIESYNIIGELNRVMQSSERVYKLIKINEKRFKINGVIYKNVSDLHSKSENIPILWNEHFMKIA